MGWITEAGAYLRKLLKETITQSLLLIDLLVFVGAVAIPAFQPSPSVYVAIAVLALICGAFLVHRDDARRHENDLSVRDAAIASRDAELEALRVRDSSAVSLERIADRLEQGAAPAAGRISAAPAGVDPTPELTWGLQPGRQYLFTLKDDDVSTRTRMHSSAFSELSPADEVWPNLGLTVFGRLANVGTVDFDCVSITARVPLSNRLPFDVFFPSLRSFSPFVVKAGMHEGTDIAADVVLDINLGAEEAAARLGRLEVSELTIEITMTILAIGPTGIQREVVEKLEVSLAPGLELLASRWREMGREDMIRYARADGRF